MDEALRRLLAKNEIVETIDRLFVSTDRRDWPAVRGCFTETVEFDMSSAGGGPAAPLAAQAITDAWQAGLSSLQSIHHQAGNYQVNIDGDRANASCYGVAYHHRPVRSGRNTRTFVGSYDFALTRVSGTWRISAFRFNLKFLDGNPDLHQEPPA
jgi:hypothetical protein